MQGIPILEVQLHLGLCHICGHVNFYMRRRMITSSLGSGFHHLKIVTIRKIKSKFVQHWPKLVLSISNLIVYLLEQKSYTFSK